MQDALFEDGSDMPLFTETRDPRQASAGLPRPAVLPGQLLLLDAACRTLPWTAAKSAWASEVRFCWCPAGQEMAPPERRTTVTVCSPKYTCEGCGRQAAGGGPTLLLVLPGGCVLQPTDAYNGCPGTSRDAELNSMDAEAHLGDRKGGASMVEIYNQHGKLIHRQPQHCAGSWTTPGGSVCGLPAPILRRTARACCV